ncbi:MAG: uroporphyrinogen-III synthase [Methyloceanibacter sp.]|uniref:uroporphyrinogen-III synthase n=1 Tax=Methyloceanibacter sp. TaxID=1965321 RepID=UPI003EE223BD
MGLMRVLVTRPEPDARGEADALRARGYEPVLAPLLEIEFLKGVPLDLDGAQAVVITSRNALRALADHPQREEVAALPLFAVGEATAWAGRQFGFSEVTIGPGTGAGLPPIIRREVHPEKGPLVHIGAEKVAFDLQGALEEDGFELRRVVLYRSHPVEILPDAVVADLASGEISRVLLLSPRTARTFARLAQHHGVVTETKDLVCYCLSKAIAEAVAPLGFTVRVPQHAREEDLLALLDSDASSS